MLSLILPTYNEAENLPRVLADIANILGGASFEIIVVDDDSPDGTAKIAEDFGKRDPRIRVIRRVGRRGLSSAVVEGFEAAVGSVVAVADADGQHDYALLPKLYDTVTAHGGMAIGSRYVAGGSIGQWDERRRLLSRIATNLASKLSRVSVADPMSGFFAMDRSLFLTIRHRLRPTGFKILFDILLHLPAPTPVTELPYTFRPRQLGKSKLSLRVEWEFVSMLLRALLQRLSPFRP